PGCAHRYRAGSYILLVGDRCGRCDNGVERLEQLGRRTVVLHDVVDPVAVERRLAGVLSADVEASAVALAADDDATQAGNRLGCFGDPTGGEHDRPAAVGRPTHGPRTPHVRDEHVTAGFGTDHLQQPADLRDALSAVPPAPTHDR